MELKDFVSRTPHSCYTVPQARGTRFVVSFGRWFVKNRVSLSVKSGTKIFCIACAAILLNGTELGHVSEVSLNRMSALVGEIENTRFSGACATRPLYSSVGSGDQNLTFSQFEVRFLEK